jgi:hypothetical protein
MRGPFAVLALSSLFVLTGLEGVASAQRKPVVIEMFKGPNAPRVRAVVAKALMKSGLTVVTDKKLAAIEADLGLVKVSENYPAIARETKAVGFVAGIVTGGRRPKARVVVRNPEGKIIGAQGWQATGFGKLLLAVNGTAGPKIAGIISAGGGGGAPAEKPAVAGKAAAEDDVLAAAEKPAKGAPAEEAAAEEEDPAPRKRKSKAGDEEKSEEGEAAEGDADAEVAAEADEDEPKAKKKAVAGTGLNIAFVMRMFSRNFAYNDNKRGLQQGYQAPEERYNNLPLVPAPGIALEFFPGALGGYGGVFGSYNRAIIGSKDSPGAGQEPSVYKTSAHSWLIGAKGRFPISTLHLEPSVGYGSHAFKVENFSSAPTRIQVAPVDYRHLRLGGGLRLPFGKDNSFVAGGHYLHILSAGTIINGKDCPVGQTQAADCRYFKGAALGGELFAGVDLPLSFVKGLNFTAGLDFRRITFAFTPNMTAERVAGGAVDQYVGMNLGVGYNLNL